MISFDPNYSRDILNEIISASVFGPEKEEEESIETLPLKFTNLNVYEPQDIWQSHSGTAGSSSWIGTNLIICPIELGSVVIWEEDAKVKAAREVRHSYASRIEFLQEEATIEDVTFNKGASCKIIESNGCLRNLTTSTVKRTDKVRKKTGLRLFLGPQRLNVQQLRITQVPEHGTLPPAHVQKQIKGKNKQRSAEQSHQLIHSKRHDAEHKMAKRLRMTPHPKMSAPELIL